MKKLKIYYLLANGSELQPISGDRINEINVIKALLKNFDVYYNGEKCHPADRSYGRTDGVITVPKLGEYDLVYVRNNKEVFLQAPSPKLWFASPFDQDCFDAADGIVCMTQPWKDRLATYSAQDYEYFVEMYPKDMVAPEHCLLFPQVIDLPGNDTIAAIRVKKDQPKQRSGFLAKTFGKTTKSLPTLRHFGPVRPSNYPHQLVHLLEEHEGLASRFSAECVGPGKRLAIPESLVSIDRVEPEIAFEMLVNSDAVWYNQDESGNVAGSLKVLEAMAAGVPVLAPRYDARSVELGAEYPFFWELSPGSTIRDVVQADFESTLERLIDLEGSERQRLSESLRERAWTHSFESIAPIVANEIYHFMASR